MKQTSKYQLNLIENSDRFSPSIINENTQALEDALISHNVDPNAHSALQTATSNHIGDKNNPHGVTATQVGAAPSSHNHSATNITSGTLSTARGGTGNTSVDTTPTSGSTKMVTSGGIYAALAGKSDSGHTHSAGNITSGTLPVARGGTGNTSVDTTPTSGSTKMVTSGGVYTALEGKAASSHNHSASNITSGTLPVTRGGTGNTSVDTAPTSGSTKMVTSGGVYTALQSLKETVGNCNVLTGSYVGAGTYGSRDKNTLTFPHAPKMLVILNNGGSSFALLLQGVMKGMLFNGSATSSYDVTWSEDGKTVAWHSTTNAGYQLNTQDVVYPYFVFC